MGYARALQDEAHFSTLQVEYQRKLRKICVHTVRETRRPNSDVVKTSHNEFPSACTVHSTGHSQPVLHIISLYCNP